MMKAPDKGVCVIMIDNKAIEEIFDEISHNIRKNISKHELALQDTRTTLVEHISETKNKIIKEAKNDTINEHKIEEHMQHLKEAILDGAGEIKGIGQDIGGNKGYEFEDISNDIIDFAEEEYDELTSELIQ